MKKRPIEWLLVLADSLLLLANVLSVLTDSLLSLANILLVLTDSLLSLANILLVLADSLLVLTDVLLVRTNNLSELTPRLIAGTFNPLLSALSCFLLVLLLLVALFTYCIFNLLHNNATASGKCLQRHFFRKFPVLIPFFKHREAIKLRLNPLAARGWVNWQG